MENERNTKQLIKTSNGITLIALVITIIVLLILAAVSIVALTGDNGILVQAGKAKEETRGASVEEARDLWKINQETDNYTENGTAQTLEQLINDLVNQKLLTEDEKDQILGNDSKGIEATYKVAIGSRTIIFKNPDINSLKAGEYVNYIDKNGNTIKCVVLYDKDYNQKNSTNYGIQIISADCVDELTVPTGYETYNNIISILYEKAQEYLNSDYASVARCVGSIPDDPDDDPDEMYINTDYEFMNQYNGKFKVDYDNTSIDINQLRNLGIFSVTNDSGYWFVTRSIGIGGVDYGGVINNYVRMAYFDYCRYVSSCFEEIYDNGTRKYGPVNITYGFRPVFTLINDLEIVNGEGTVDLPYNLGK